MFHLVLHGLVPLVVALLAYRARWRLALVVMLATMAVDVDHLLADPVYDPLRCSIGFHPLHTVTAITVYVALFLGPWCVSAWRKRPLEGPAWFIHVAGLGLLIHMLLDGIDCLA